MRRPAIRSTAHDPIFEVNRMRDEEGRKRKSEYRLRVLGNGGMNRVGGGYERGICEGRGGAGKEIGSGISVGRGGIGAEGTRAAGVEIERGEEEEEEGSVVVVSGDEGERRTGGQESEEEGSLLVDTNGDSDMEGVGWAARGETETEGFSDGGRGMGCGERVVRRGRRMGGGGGEGGGRGGRAKGWRGWGGSIVLIRGKQNQRMRTWGQEENRWGKGSEERDLAGGMEGTGRVKGSMCIGGQGGGGMGGGAAPPVLVSNVT